MCIEFNDSSFYSWFWQSDGKLALDDSVGLSGFDFQDAAAAVRATNGPICWGLNFATNFQYFINGKTTAYYWTDLAGAAGTYAPGSKTATTWQFSAIPGSGPFYGASYYLIAAFQ